MDSFLRFVDRLNQAVGHAFAWCILILTLGVSYEVFVRYVLGAPTSWAYDISYVMYGALFFMAGAYALSRDSHVRADIFYRLWPPRVQAAVDLALYLVFFLPTMVALIWAGTRFAHMSWRFGEVSIFGRAGVPVYPSKILIPIGAALLLVQGLSEVIRCVRCLNTGQWPQRIHDVEELEKQILEEHAKKAAAEPPAGMLR